MCFERAVNILCYRVFDVQQREKTNTGKTEKSTKSCEITESQPKKHKIF